ncbi:MAG: sigma 54-interacting transcriptional regulator, partial [Deltaproteobacteria bacterium]|nr:sigma 54-interacting transcriptional regulator [Deltaproteobacteria bacterium]
QRVQKTGKYLLVTSTPVFDDNGAITMVVSTEQDLTHLEELREQLQQSRRLSNKFGQELSELNLMELRKQEIIAESKEMRQVLRTGLKLGALGVSNILILGESGTGKGLLAKFIHENGKRKGNPFVQVNCAALPETLLEAELFGYEKGAFTGAHQDGKAGLFELADRGTLFLDEIGELPLSVQAKFLKYLDDQEILHLGGLKPLKIDCTVIAATNRDLEKQIREGLFREDLFYRLNAFTITIPPLRKRKSDILELTNFLFRKYNRQYRTHKKLSPKALSKILSYSFPGNIRELDNIVKKAIVLSEDEQIDGELLRALADGEKTISPSPDALEKTKGNRLSDQLQALEKQLLTDAMVQCKSTRKAAAVLGTSQSNVMRKLKKYGLSPFKS